MGRRSTIWPRKGRGWYTTFRGRQIPLGRDKAEAEREFHRLHLDQPRVLHSLSVRALVAKFLAERQEELAPQSFSTYRSILDRWCQDYGSMRASELVPYHLKDWLSARWRNRSTQGIKGKVIKVWSRWCAEWGYIDADRLSLARLPSVNRRSGADPADLELLERNIRDPDFADLWLFLRDTGCRPGEATTLEASGVLWKQSAAEVCGKRGKRIVGLTPAVLAMLKRRAKVHGPLLTTKGARWSRSSIKRACDLAQQGLELSGHIVPYHLRHNLWAKWNEAGISDVLIARQFGHMSRGVPHTGELKRTYAHASAQSLASAALQASSGANPRPTHRPSRSVRTARCKR
jgi:site-specific recombinase XerD